MIIKDIKSIDDLKQWLAVSKNSSPERSFKTHNPYMYGNIVNEYGETFNEKLFNYVSQTAGFKCLHCSSDTPFWNLSRGYRQYCGIGCSTQSSVRKQREAETKKDADWDARTAKTQATNLERYGHISTLHAEEFRGEIKQKIAQKMDVLMQKVAETNLKRHGVKYFTQSQKCIDASKDRHTELWPEKHLQTLLNHLKSQDLTLLDNPVSRPDTLTLRHSCGHEFTVLNRSVFDISCPSCTVRGSKPERSLAEFLSSLTQIERGNRKIIKPYEIDLYLPKYKVGIEMNGLYWHRDGGTSLPLVKKTEMCKKSGVRLIHVWENEWINHREKVEMFFKSMLGVNTRYEARKLTIKEVSYHEAKAFCELHHRQNWAQASIRIGLYQDDKLVQLLTAGKPRFSKKYDLEIIRVCSNGTVIGGLNKLVKALKKKYPTHSIFTYCDNRWGNGNSYVNAGFKYMGDTKPGYFYTNGSMQIKTRYECQFNKLPLVLENFNPLLTEEENMKNHGFWKCSDAGNGIFVLT